ncbi:MAG: alanine--tRNA ligase-related protein [Clostridia bacterium]|nr:alanine--tRNA ligase-related protein [Clostridia bacterium]
MTETLYSTECYCTNFTATVLSCIKEDDRYAVILDKTAFFPEQGGQYADTGTLGPTCVLDVQIKDGVITHYTDRPLMKGTSVFGIIDWKKRFSRMQNHTGEHIVSGIIHAHFGYDNVGFHLNDSEGTLDLNGTLTRDQLEQAENEANEAVSRNVTIHILFPTADQLPTMSYRSKLELTENVRIISIPGFDTCACCAPHVRTTGEIGIIKILEAVRYKGGMRIHLKCGAYAMEDYKMRYAVTTVTANALHIRPEEIPEGIERLSAQISSLKAELNAVRREYLAQRAAALEYTDGNLCFIEAGADIQALRDLVNAGTEKCSGICAAFAGDDQSGYLFVIGSKSIPLRKRAGEITAALQGRGGGTDQMISGSVTAPAAMIRSFISHFTA